jgi:predicted phosphodiesterase
VRLATKDEATDFQVAVNAQGEYEIRDANGSVLPNLRPALKITDSGSAARVVQRLVHLTKYRNIRMIDNTDPSSTLARQLVVELGSRVPPKEGEEGFGTFGEVLGLRSRPISVGEIIFLRITNKSAKAVNLTVLDLQPDWGISQVYPPPGGEEERDYELLEPGEENALLIPVQTALPDGYQSGTDIIKAIAAVDGMSFRWLELPALDQPVTRAITKGPSNPLEELMAAFGSEELTRAIIPLTTAKAKSWGTAEVEIKVRRPTIAHVHDPAFSLLQSAFDEVVAQKEGATKSRSVGGTEVEVKRPELSDPIINEVAQYCVAVANGELSADDLPSLDQEGLSEGQSRALAEAQERGVVDTVKYCASMAAGVAKNLWAAKVRGDTVLYNQYKDAATKKFGDCDPNYREAVLQYVKLLVNKQDIPYVQWKQQSDFVVEDEAKLPTDGIIGLVADWGTGEPEAVEVLRQVKRHNPHVAMHLGDIYYAGTEHEVENYFYQPWKKVLELDTSKITSFVLPGNHDLYAGGAGFYGLLKKLGQEASFFCLRNKHWQLIGMDTALNDKLAGVPTSLHETEAKWVVDKIENAGGRRTILLSHHQLFSTNEQFDGKSYNQNLYDQLSSVLSKVDLWLWGHEHDLVIFDEYKGLKRGRCVGGSAFPVGNFEMPTTHVNEDVPYNKNVELSKGSSFYQHCYAIIKLDGPNAKVFYYEDRDGGNLLYTDEL